MELNFNELLEQMAQAFNTTVDKLYPILIKQAYVSGTISILEFIGSLTLLFVVYKLTMKNKSKYNSANEYHVWDWTVQGVPWILGLIVATFLTIVTFFLMTSNAPTAFLNPEYWTIKEILSNIKN